VCRSPALERLDVSCPHPARWLPAGCAAAGHRENRSAGRRTSRRLIFRAHTRREPRPGRTVGRVYDHDLEDVEVLGWAEFIARQWESIFAGYRSRNGLRKMCRRWSDLFEIGLGCSQDIADMLVRTEIIDRADRDLEGAPDAQAVVSGMAEVLADLRADLVELAEVDPGLSARLLEQHARLLSYVHAYAFGQDAGEVPGA
jgi:hypothetical protein